MKWLALLLITTIAVVAPLSAEVVTNESVPITITVFVPCADGGAGEVVALSGKLHVLSAVTIDAAGGLHLKQQFQPQGVSGVGMTTGAKYRAVGETQQTMYTAQPSFPFSMTLTNNFKIIGAGPDNNYLVHETVHVTVNADGQTTTQVDNLKVECR